METDVYHSLLVMADGITLNCKLRFRDKVFTNKRLLLNKKKYLEECSLTYFCGQHLKIILNKRLEQPPFLRIVIPLQK